MPKHPSQFTRKQNQMKERKSKRPRMPPPPPPIDEIPTPRVRALESRGFTNRLQEYLGTYVPGRVTPNQMATMPQNYYKFNPTNMNRQIMYQNFMTDNASLPLPEFKHQLEQLYRQHHLRPIPFSQEDETYFNTFGQAHGVEPVRLRMNLPYPHIIPLYSTEDDPTMYSVDTMRRWGTVINHHGLTVLPITTVQQIDRFILRDYEHVDPNDDEEIRIKRIRSLGSDELEWLIHGIANPGVSPPADTRLVIRYNDEFYNTYAELAHAMGIPESQVANFEAAPFMRSLLTPPRRNPTRKCRKS